VIYCTLYVKALNASKKIMRHVPGTELERYVVQKVSILLFVSVFRRAFRISLLLNH
jgi:hypothetical protein